MAGEILEARTLLAAVKWEGGVDLYGDGTSWNDPLNWAGDMVPRASDDVVIGAGFGGIVYSGGQVNNMLSIATSDSTVTFGPNLTVHGANGDLQPGFSDSRFINQGTIAADAGGRIDIGWSPWRGGTDAGNLVNQGTLAASSNGFLYVHTDS